MRTQSGGPLVTCIVLGISGLPLCRRRFRQARTRAEAWTCAEAGLALEWCRRSAHGPARQGFRTRLGETIDAALDPDEPAVHVVQEYLRGIRSGDLDLGC